MNEFVIERADGSVRRISGYKASQPRENSKVYSSDQYSAEDLPAKVDLRKHMTPIENQQDTNSCVANAVAGAYEYLAKRYTGETYDVSRLFIYYNARYLQNQYQEYDGDVEDEGCLIQDAIESLKEYGACSEETYPFDTELVNEEPPQEAYDEAAEFIVEEAENVPVNLNAWKQCLAQGYPIIFGINLYQSFDSPPRKGGKIPTPSKNESSRASHGGHAMLAVGYSDPDKVFIVRNSWGTKWGDQGYCYIPYDYLINKKFNDGDSWIIRQLENIDFNNEENWDNNEESILQDYNTELEDFTDEQYDNLLDALGDFSFELRIALFFLRAADADGELSDEEYEKIGEHMQDVLDKLGVIDISAAKILRRAERYLNDDELYYETLEIFNEYFSHSFLAHLVQDVQKVIGVDGLSDEEAGFVHELVDTWQVQEFLEENNEEESEEDEEDEAAIREQRRQRYTKIVPKAHESEEDEGYDDEEPEEDDGYDDEDHEEDEGYDDEEPEEDEGYDDEEPEEDEDHDDEEPEEDEGYDDEEPEEDEGYDDEEPEEDEGYDDEEPEEDEGYDDEEPEEDEGYDDEEPEEDEGYDDEEPEEDEGYDDEEPEEDEGYDDEEPEEDEGYDDEE